MGILDNLEPKRVFYYFEEICKIPHGSRNTKQISDYLVSFAKEQGLKYIQDEANNVVIFKDATPGYENAPTVILQGHCDMVTEKVPGSTHDFLTDGLDLEVKGDYVSAKETTLGGDDGIAVAYMMAILESKDLPHPALEAVITTDEEIGLLGAVALDASVLKGTMLINLDSEAEGSLWVGCAGGATAVSKIPVKYLPVEGTSVEVIIDGLKGGHSGAEIDKIRANSNILMGRYLHGAGLKIPFALAQLEGGLKDNAIPRMTSAVLVLEDEDINSLTEFTSEFEEALRTEYSGTDEGITITIKTCENGEVSVLDTASKEKIIFFLMNIPNGIQKMSGDIAGLVETSTNLGILRLEEGYCVASSSVRSSVGSAKDALIEKHCYLTEFLGGDFSIEGAYPAWEYKKESRLRDLMVDVYEKELNLTPEVVVIHAGLECGLFYEKIDGLDCVSFGPNMENIHTTEEVLSISSTERMWKYLTKVLEAIKE